MSKYWLLVFVGLLLCIIVVMMYVVVISSPLVNLLGGI